MNKQKNEWNFPFSKKELETTLKKFEAPKWIKFAFRYFSKETEASDMNVSRSIIWTLLSLFLVGFSATVANLPKIIILWSTGIYVVILVSLVLFLFSAAYMNIRRIKKIIYYLVCTPEEYNRAIKLLK